MIEGLITGRLTTDPSERTDRFGKTFMVARMRATVGDGNLRPNAAAEIPSSLFVNVVAFDPVPCKQLLDLQEGDVVSIVGPLTPKVWTDKQGRDLQMKKDYCQQNKDNSLCCVYYISRAWEEVTTEPVQHSKNRLLISVIKRKSV